MRFRSLYYAIYERIMGKEHPLKHVSPNNIIRNAFIYGFSSPEVISPDNRLRNAFVPGLSDSRRAPQDNRTLEEA
jgi:hypothetical protein